MRASTLLDIATARASGTVPVSSYTEPAVVETPWPSITTDDFAEPAAWAESTAGLTICPARMTVTGVLSGAALVAPANELMTVIEHPHGAASARVLSEFLLELLTC
ncbi:hypothetical protein D3C87_1824490 [compost metagenome]